MLILRRGCVAVFLSLGIACGSSSNSVSPPSNAADGDGGDGGTVDAPDGAVPTGPATGWSSFVESWCELQNPCCTAAGLKTDRLQCQEVFHRLFDRPDNPYDAAAGNQCLAQLRRWAKTPLLCAITIDSGGPSCQRLTPRKGALHDKKPGEACENLHDCASSTEGEVDCVATEADGGHGKICQLQVVGREGDGPCVRLYDGGNLLTVRTIQKEPPAKVAVCHRSDHLRCDEAARTCRPARALGEACDYDCDVGLGCIDGHCATPHVPGESCAGGTSGDICTPGVFCSQGKCLAPAEDGQPCVASAGCKSLFCDSKICKSQSESALRSTWCGK